jgi:hypothetical protein
VRVPPTGFGKVHDFQGDKICHLIAFTEVKLGLAKAGGSGLLRLAFPDRAAELGNLQGLAQHGTGRDDISLKKLVSAHQDDRNLRSSVIDHAH